MKTIQRVNEGTETANAHNSCTQFMLKNLEDNDNNMSPNRHLLLFIYVTSQPSLTVPDHGLLSHEYFGDGQ